MGPGAGDRDAEGAVNAISVCKDQAPAIADSLWVDDVRIGRTSRSSRVVSLANNREGYVEPIMIQPLCLACHGEALAPDVAAQIEAMIGEVM